MLMKLRSRIHISAPHTLEGDAYDKILTLRDTWSREWNKGHHTQFDEFGLVVVEREDPEYQELRQFFLNRANDVPPEWLTWYEKLEAVYSLTELRQYEILELHINGEAGLGGNTYGLVYELNACDACGKVTIRRQLRDLMTDLTKVKKDFATTLDFTEVLTSDRVRAILKEARVDGVELRPVEHVRPSRRPKRRYFQLLVHNVLRPLLAPRPNWTTSCPSCSRQMDAQNAGPERPDPWTEIHLWVPGPWDELHFPKGSWKRWDMMRTEDVFGGPVLPSDPRPQFARLLISQHVFRLFSQHKISGFWVQPAHID